MPVQFVTEHKKTKILIYKKKSSPKEKILKIWIWLLLSHQNVRKNKRKSNQTKCLQFRTLLSSSKATECDHFVTSRQTSITHAFCARIASILSFNSKSQNQLTEIWAIFMPIVSRSPPRVESQRQTFCTKDFVVDVARYSVFVAFAPDLVTFVLVLKAGESFFFSCCLPRVVWDAARLWVAGMSSARDEAQICLPAFLWSSFETVHFRTTRRVESVGVFGAGSAAGWWLRCGVASACRSAMRLDTSFDKHTASVSHFSYCFFMWQPTICADPEAPLHRTAPPGFWFGSFISRHNTSYGELFFLYILSTFRPFTARLRTDAYFFFACCCDGKIHHKHTLIFLIFMFHLPVAIGLPHTHTQFRVCGMWRTQKKKKRKVI